MINITEGIKRKMQALNVVAATKLRASRPWEYFTPHCRAAASQWYCVASFATLLVLSCLHPPGLGCSRCNVARFCCDLEACSLVTTGVAEQQNKVEERRRKGRVQVYEGNSGTYKLQTTLLYELPDIVFCKWKSYKYCILWRWGLSCGLLHCVIWQKSAVLQRWLLVQ
jgi:hypothetical protein